ncbi:MAG: hypothetical protein KO463_03505, partial [Candidatus Methanofastidiosa archaeon]|nr:hypothetical protein [Candidatus Methanofastidiosa archaeon]
PVIVAVDGHVQDGDRFGGFGAERQRHCGRSAKHHRREKCIPEKPSLTRIHRRASIDKPPIVPRSTAGRVTSIADSPRGLNAACRFGRTQCTSTG